MVDGRFYQHLGPLSLITLLDGLAIDIPEGSFSDILIKSAAPVSAAATGDISYFDAGKKTVTSIETKASVCLVREKDVQSLAESGCLPLISLNPRADFARILSRLFSKKDKLTQAGDNSFPGAIVAASARIGRNVKIGNGSVIGHNTVIGSGCSIGENCHIGANVVIECSDIGNNCSISHGGVVGGSGFGVVVDNKENIDILHVGSVRLGNNVSIGSLSAVDRAMFGATEIGDGGKFDNLVQIAHNVQIGKNCRIAAQTGISGSCKIGDDVLMGGQVGVADHITIGNGATLAAQCGVMHNIPAGEMWSGIPAKLIRDHMREVSFLRKAAIPKRKT